jgi:hypothetical protein
VRADGVRGLFVTQGVDEGTPLLGIPAACTLCASDGGEGGGGDGKDGELGLTKRHERLMASLLSPPDDAEAYVATLPASMPLLRDRTDAELGMLGSSQLAAAARSQRAWAKRTVARMASRLGVDPLVVEWAERVVRTRAVRDTTQGGEHVLRLVPLLDLANHRAGNGETSPILHMADGMVALCATEPLSAGDEVTFPYRQGISNEELLLDYGFGDE